MEKNEKSLWVAYYRVSTKKQGLGLDAQKRRVEAEAARRNATIIAEVEEKESGKDNDRPGLNKALMLAKKHNATIAVAKHDRLTRDLAFAAYLVFKTNVNFEILNLPAEAMTDPLLFGVFFGLADKEGKMISERTKAALAERKAQGIKLGNPNGAKALLTDEVKARASESRKNKADNDRNNIVAAHEVRKVLECGKTSLRKIADHLNDKGIRTSRDNEWTGKGVQLLCKRFGIAYK